MRKNIQVLLFLFMGIAVNVKSQNGYLDDSFNGSGFNLSVSVDYPMLIPFDMLIQPDQKSVVACEGYTASGRDLVLIRYNFNGTLDETFGTGGFVSYDADGMVERVTSLAIQSDGNLIAGGNMYISEGDIYPTKWFSVRFHADGTIDTSYGESGAALIGSAEFVPMKTFDCAIQSDDKLLLVGETNTDGYRRGTVVRLDINGQLDLTFGTNGVFYPYPQEVYNGIKGVKIQPDGMIVVCGDLLVQPNLLENDYLVMRFDQNGLLDGTFGTDGIVTLDSGSLYGSMMYLSFQNDGRILGSGTYYQGLTTGGYNTSLIRLNVDGSLDTDFAENGLAIAEFNPLSEDLPHGIVLKSDGKIALAFATVQLAPANYSKFMLMQFLSDGTPDPSFGVDGLVQLNLTGGDAAQAIDIQSDDKILMSGIGTNPADNMQTTVIARLLPVATTIGLSESTSGMSCAIYPNPVNEAPVLTYELLNSVTITIGLYDMDGKLIRNYVTGQSMSAGMHYLDIDLSSVRGSGMYTLMLSDEAGRKATLRFIRQ